MNASAGPDIRAAQHDDSWSVERLTGPASELLAAPEPDPARRLIRIHTVERAALVLGSTQRFDSVDHERAAAAGVEVTKRRSGGGAVLLVPNRQVWIDFFAPRGDPLYGDDVTASALWAGELWSAVLAEFAAGSVTMHTRGLVANRWGKLVCFAGTGPGEVFVDGSKVVGISQRRSRDRVRIQTTARVTPPTDELDELDELDLLDLTSAQRAEGRAETKGRSGTVTAREADLIERLLRLLSAARTEPAAT